MRVKMSKQPPPAPTASAVGPCPTLIQTSRTPRTWKFIQDHRTTRPPPPPPGARAYSDRGVGILSFLSPYLWETARFRLKYCLKGSLNPKQPTYSARSRCGWGLFGHFSLSSILSILFVHLFGRRLDID